MESKELLELVAKVSGVPKDFLKETSSRDAGAFTCKIFTCTRDQEEYELLMKKGIPFEFRGWFGMFDEITLKEAAEDIKEEKKSVAVSEQK